jgi:hypothetical protein
VEFVMSPTFIPKRTTRRRGRGVSLVFALIGLAVLSLAAVALVRSVDTGTLVLGNLGFKQDATRSGDQGAEQAIGWLTGVARTVLNNSDAARNYWATAYDNIDATGNNDADVARAVIDWKDDNCASYPSGTFANCLRLGTPSATVNGNQTRYAIFRMCPIEGAPNAAGNDCARPTAYSEPGDVTRGEINYRKYERLTLKGAGSSETVYYRIVVRTVGGKDAVSFSETIVTY